MITVRQTDINEVLGSKSLLDDYAAESKGALVPEIDPSMDKYNLLQDTGVLYTVGVYYSSYIVGFATFFLSEMLHYSEMAATIESVFIHEDYRSHGTGKRLFDELESLAAEKGAVNLFVSAPKGSRLDKISRSLGLVHTNNTYTKKI